MKLRPLFIITLMLLTAFLGIIIGWEYSNQKAEAFEFPPEIAPWIGEFTLLVPGDEEHYTLNTSSDGEKIVAWGSGWLLVIDPETNYADIRRGCEIWEGLAMLGPVGIEGKTILIELQSFSKEDCDDMIIWEGLEL